jgi:hypothetical protein
VCVCVCRVEGRMLDDHAWGYSIGRMSKTKLRHGMRRCEEENYECGIMVFVRSDFEALGCGFKMG